MILTKEHLEKIKDYLPTQRKPEDVEMINFLNALLYIIENGCKWRTILEKYENQHTIYTRFNRWCKNGMLATVFAALQNENIIDIRTEVVCIDSTSVKVYPDATGALKKHGAQAIGRSKGGSQPCVSAEFALSFHLSPGNNHDAPEGRKLTVTLCSWTRLMKMKKLVMPQEHRVLSLSCHPGITAKSRGNMIKNCTSAETRFNDIFCV